jgi:hypothetical protein
MTRIDTMQMPNASRTAILAGVLPYFDFSVLAEHSVIGLKRR